VKPEGKEGNSGRFSNENENKFITPGRFTDYPVSYRVANLKLFGEVLSNGSCWFMEDMIWFFAVVVRIIRKYYTIL